MEEIQRDLLSILVIVLLILGFGLLVYLPNCCQRYTEQRKRSIVYPIDRESAKSSEIQIIEDSWCSKSVSSGDTSTDSSSSGYDDHTGSTDQFEELDEVDSRTVEEIIKITVHCPGGKARRKNRFTKNIENPTSKVVRNLNREIAAIRSYRQSFAV